MPRPTSLACAVVLVAALASTAVGCGDDDAQVSTERSDQVRAAALEAGLPDDVADVLALAALGPTATFQVTYAGSENANIVVYQEPPNRRVDVVKSGRTVESRLLRDGVSYLCQPDAQAGAAAPLKCTRDASALSAPGAFSNKALDDFTDSLSASKGTLDLTVDERRVADTMAQCLITAPKAGTELDGTGPTVDTLCVSPEGAQLLVDVDGDRVVANAYSTDVPEGTFDV